MAYENKPGKYSHSKPAPVPVESAVYYTDKEKKKLNTKWVDEEALKVAQEVGNEKLKSAQLRRFYSEVKTLERVWTTRGQTAEAFLELLPQIKILKAKVVYAKERGVAGDYFQRWMAEHVNAIKDVEDFKAFLLHFEAVVGFSKKYLKD